MKPVSKMKRAELESEAKRLGIRNTERYLTPELRIAVRARRRA